VLEFVSTQLGQFVFKDKHDVFAECQCEYFDKQLLSDLSLLVTAKITKFKHPGYVLFHELGFDEYLHQVTFDDCLHFWFYIYYFGNIVEQALIVEETLNQNIVKVTDNLIEICLCYAVAELYDNL